jgi:hypothetical protein
VTGKERRLLQRASLVIEELARAAVGGKNPGTKLIHRAHATLRKIWDVAGIPLDSQVAIESELYELGRWLERGGKPRKRRT